MLEHSRFQAVYVEYFLSADPVGFQSQKRAQQKCEPVKTPRFSAGLTEIQEVNFRDEKRKRFS